MKKVKPRKKPIAIDKDKLDAPTKALLEELSLRLNLKEAIVIELCQTLYQSIKAKE